MFALFQWGYATSSALLTLLARLLQCVSGIALMRKRTCICMPVHASAQSDEMPQVRHSFTIEACTALHRSCMLVAILLRVLATVHPDSMALLMGFAIPCIIGAALHQPQPWQPVRICLLLCVPWGGMPCRRLSVSCSHIRGLNGRHGSGSALPPNLPVPSLA